MNTNTTAQPFVSFSEVSGLLQETFTAIATEMIRVKEGTGEWPTVGTAFDNLRMRQLGWTQEQPRTGTASVVLDADTAYALARKRDYLSSLSGEALTPSDTIEALMARSTYWQEVIDHHTDTARAAIEGVNQQAADLIENDTGIVQ